MKTNTLKLVRLLPTLALGGLLASGCAQNMALNKPGPFTPACLKPGVERTEIIAELGHPVSSKQQDRLLTEDYKYVDGGSNNSIDAKTGRVWLYSAGDLFTLFIDQIVWVPIEKFSLTGTEHTVIVEYTKSDDGVWQAKNVEDTVAKASTARK